MGRAIAETAICEPGRTTRVVYARLLPNEDLVAGVEKLCLANGIYDGLVRASLGSLTDACLRTAENRDIELAGPAIEVLFLSGEVRSDAQGVPTATLSGLVADTQGRTYGGVFVAGRNPVCITFELSLEEWRATGGAAA